MALRRSGFLILSVAAVVVLFVMGPDEDQSPDTGGYSNAVSQALDEAERNEERASAAPQQQVVNGWVARDLLTILAEQNNDIITSNAQAAGDDRTPALLVLLVLGVSLHAVTMPTTTRQDTASNARLDDAPAASGSAEGGTAPSSRESSTALRPRSDVESGDETYGHG